MCILYISSMLGKTRQKFYVTLKPNVELKRQRASKVPLHMKDKFEKQLTQLKDADIIREMGDDDEMGSLFVNPIILMPKKDYVKLVIDARYMNSVIDLTNFSGPLEPVQMIITGVNGKFFSVIDLPCAYHQVLLSFETQKLTSFIIGGRQYTFTRGFYGLCILPNFFSRLMTTQFDPLMRKKQAITYLEDTIMQSQTRSEMFTIINEYHTLLRKAGLKADPDKTFLFLKKIKFLGRVISPDGIQPIAKRIDALRNLKSPQTKRDVMKVLGCLGFYNRYFKNLHVDSQPFYHLIKDSTPFHWTEEHETLFNSIKETIHKDTVLSVPSTDYPFHIHVDSSNVGTGCILIQQFPEGKRIISFKPRVFEKAEKKIHCSPRTLWNRINSPDIRTLHYWITISRLSLLWALTSSLSMGTQRTTIASLFPLSGDHNENPELKDHLDARLELSLSRYSQQKHYDRKNQMHQMQHKCMPPDIEFYDEHRTPVTYQIQHEDNLNDTCNDFYPIKYKRGNEEKILRLQNDGEEYSVSSMIDEFPITSIQQPSDCFRMGRFIQQFRRICGPETQSNASVNTSNAEYSSINFLSRTEDDAADSTSPGDDSHHLSTDSEDDNIVCEISIQAG